VSQTRRTRDGLGNFEVRLILVRWLKSAFGVAPELIKDDSNRPSLAFIRSGSPTSSFIAIFRPLILSELT